MEHTGHRFAWQIETPKPIFLTLPLFFYPFWSVTVDGEGVRAGPVAGSRLIEVFLEAGTHNVEIRREMLWQERYGLGISVAAALVLVSILFRRTRRRLSG
jgi:hypothetical protein